MKRIVGYADRFSVAPGGRIAFMVSCEDAADYRAEIVRLRAIDDQTAGSDLEFQVVPTDIEGVYAGRRQKIHAGSYVILRGEANLDLESFTLQALIWPTTPLKGSQAIIAKWTAEAAAGFVLMIDDKGACCLRLGDGRGRTESLSATVPLLARHWYLVAATWNAETGVAGVVQESLTSYPKLQLSAEAERQWSEFGPAKTDAPLTLACSQKSLRGTRAAVFEHFNGKIERPVVAKRPLSREERWSLTTGPIPNELAPLVAGAWDFSQEMAGDQVRDLSGAGRHGRTVNLPTRAMKGHNWSGEVQCWRDAPAQYGAIHFHEDDVYDAGWSMDFELTVPGDLQSGIYAARLCAADQSEAMDCDYIPFFVRPPPGGATADILLLAPTASYMAYANEHSAFNTSVELLSGVVSGVNAEDLFLNEHREYGSSLYDAHTDGSGVCYSSRLRPILTMRPGYTMPCVGPGGSGLWQFSADLHIADWLNAMDRRYDVATDEDLHCEGVALLGRYRVVVTGTHPEYYSTAMWDAVQKYLRQGGRLMYLGANGFYWRIAFNEDLPGVIELRRAEDGVRAWTAEPGEYYHGFTGEYGGLWRRLGRPPQSLVGIGFSGQGFDVCSHFKRRPDSYDPRAAFVFEGIEEEIIGNFGVIGGGAAGLEIDRFDPALGSPPNALVLASSEGLTGLYYPGPEEVDSVLPNLGADHNARVRGDVVLFETANDGAVFGVGSIAWAGSLNWNAYDNNVSRMTGNVLRRFLDPAPIFA